MKTIDFLFIGVLASAFVCLLTVSIISIRRLSTPTPPAVEAEGPHVTPIGTVVLPRFTVKHVRVDAGMHGYLIRDTQNHTEYLFLVGGGVVRLSP